MLGLSCVYTAYFKKSGPPFDIDKTILLVICFKMSEKGQGTFMLSDSETFPVAVALAIWSL